MFNIIIELLLIINNMFNIIIIITEIKKVLFIS